MFKKIVSEQTTRSLRPRQLSTAMDLAKLCGAELQHRDRLQTRAVLLAAEGRTICQEELRYSIRRTPSPTSFSRSWRPWLEP